MNSIRKQCLAATAGAVAVWSSPALAQQTAPPPTTTPEPVVDTMLRRNADYIDITAGLGYSSNPFLEIGNSQSSAYGRLSARGVHAWGGERGQSSIAAFVEGTGYLNDYGFESIFSINADTQQQVSEKVSLFGSASVNGDLAGQLSNRFLFVPPFPVVPDPNLPPPPVTVDDPDVFSFAGRQYRIYGQGGASISVSERGNLTVSGGAQRTIYKDDLLNDFTDIFVNGSYNHSLSERTTVGFRVGATRTEYANSSSNSTIINPAVTVRTLLSENWDASAAVGVSFSDVEGPLGGSENTTNLSLDAQICRSLQTDRFCAHASRYAQSSSRASIVTTTSVGVDWFKQLDEDSTLQLSSSVVRYDSQVATLTDFRSHHFRLAASYSRNIGQRLSAGADVGIRALSQDGPDADKDIGGSLFLRYRIGDLG
jgi:hypothetical protein